MVKIAFVQPARRDMMTIYYDERAKENPYRIYTEGYEQKDGDYAPRHFKRQVNRYADLASAMYIMYVYALNNNEDVRKRP